MGYEMFDPSLGRWMTMDPIDYAAEDENLYRALSNNPVNRLDPSGLESKRWLTETIEFDKNKSVEIFVDTGVKHKSFKDTIQITVHKPKADKKLCPLDESFHFLQFTKMSFKDKDDKSVASTRTFEVLNGLYHKTDEWYTDVIDSDSIYYDSGATASIDRNEFGFSMWDEPGLTTSNDKSVVKVQNSFETYVVVGDKVIYRIQWERNNNRQADGTWKGAYENVKGEKVDKLATGLDAAKLLLGYKNVKDSKPTDPVTKQFPPK